MKMVMLVVMPLVTGGALNGVLKQFGIRLPMGLGAGMGRGAGSAGEGMGGLGGLAGLGQGAGTLQSVMGIAKMFL